ncbi:MAG: aminoacetone oxidase family FAD-binding enzyme [Candidatus Cloacimonadota bacterium]|nr:MAG: aminoacetone oxidase family FAD-binding enzyme [Candidatus Cloacimonadota bacterium]
MNQTYDIIILGAGASGMFCALHLAKKGKKVLVLEHNKYAGKKILKSGGGKCNFTNKSVKIDNYISKNPRFCHSALSQFTHDDFMSFINKHEIEYEERELGKLFCKNSSKDIQQMLLEECDNVNFIFNIQFVNASKNDDTFEIEALFKQQFTSFFCKQFIVASGSLSFKELGATNIGHKIAQQFDLKITETKPALVSLEFSKEDLEVFEGLQGIALPVQLSNQKAMFHEAMLFTHTGISGPCSLQISSYWNQQETISMNFALNFNFEDFFKQEQIDNSKKSIENSLAKHFPKKLVHCLLKKANSLPSSINNVKDIHIQQVKSLFCDYQLNPKSTSGYDKAEVTCGGVSTKDINPKTMEAKKQKGLYFIGEVLDVTGWLGGYNFQWAWSSAFACAKAID